VLSTPDAHLVLILGGDHLASGIEAVAAAVDNAVLRPHFGAIEAKRLAQRAGSRGPDVRSAAAMVDEDTVMSGAEVGKLARLMNAAGQKGDEERQLVQVLRAKAETVTLSSEGQAALAEL
jgi:hypothetical protein